MTPLPFTMPRELGLSLRLLPAAIVVACSHAPDSTPAADTVPPAQTAARAAAPPDSVVPTPAALSSRRPDLASAITALADAKPGVPMVLLPSATPARASAVIDSLVTAGVGAVLPDTAPQILATLGMPDVTLTAEMDPSARAGRLPWLMTQPDETGLRPMAAVGSRVVVAALHRGIQATAVVVARRRFKGGEHCDEASTGAQFDGFAYLLDSIVVDSAALATLRGPDDFFAWDMLPHTIAVHAQQQLPAPLRAKLREQALATARARRASSASHGDAPTTDASASFELRELHGPQGPLYAVSRRGEDDQNFLAILDARGRVELFDAAYHVLSEAGDLDGDGVDELFVSRGMDAKGIVAWHDGRWVMPSRYWGWACGN
jgi:hypothetical protein